MNGRSVFREELDEFVDWLLTRGRDSATTGSTVLSYSDHYVDMAKAFVNNVCPSTRNAVGLSIELAFLYSRIGTCCLPDDCLIDYDKVGALVEGLHAVGSGRKSVSSEDVIETRRAVRHFLEAAAWPEFEALQVETLPDVQDKSNFIAVAPSGHVCVMGEPINVVTRPFSGLLKYALARRGHVESIRIANASVLLLVQHWLSISNVAGVFSSAGYKGWEKLEDVSTFVARSLFQTERAESARGFSWFSVDNYDVWSKDIIPWCESMISIADQEGTESQTLE